MKIEKLDNLVNLLESKLDTMDDEGSDSLLTKSVLEFILALALEEKNRIGNNLVASEEEIYNLTHGE